MQTEKPIPAPGPGPTPKPIPVPAPGPVDITDSFDAITGRRRSLSGLVYLVPLALSISIYPLAPLVYLVFLTIALVVQRRTKKPSRFVRFHTMQSILLLGIINVVGIVFAIILTVQSNTGAYSSQGATFTVALVPGLLFLIGLLVAMIGAFLGKYTKLPFLWKRAEKFADRRGVAAVK